MILIGTIGGFQLFEIPYIFFPMDNGPDLAGLTIVSYLFTHGLAVGRSWRSVGDRVDAGRASSSPSRWCNID